MIPIPQEISPELTDFLQSLVDEVEQIKEQLEKVKNA